MLSGFEPYPHWVPLIFTSVPASLSRTLTPSPGFILFKMHENSDYFRLLVFQSIKLEEALVHVYDSEVRLARSRKSMKNNAEVIPSELLQII